MICGTETMFSWRLLLFCLIPDIKCKDRRCRRESNRCPKVSERFSAKAGINFLFAKAVFLCVIPDIEKYDAVISAPLVCVLRRRGNRSKIPDSPRLSGDDDGRSRRAAIGMAEISLR